ncbi:hypothetical protein E8F20_05080 [Pseudomonas sp. BN415]|uniref:hypothetical protein n=1 Tax=Pseudomonas sp. BN415 TaxID=2567889 RepID=UPI00245463AE|nr:hypothetical protein [Pseudomonas sp. BN415]MDH4581248.1 hypothetical protein [Pseudomonas sp. BN415]
MSDYFAALMRASGLFAPAAVPGLEAPPELGVEASAPASQPEPASPQDSSVPTSTEARRAVATIDRSTANVPAARPRAVDNSSESARPAPNPLRDRPASPQRNAPIPSLPEPSTAPPVSERHEGRQAPSQADERVRIAMRWVAADPQLATPTEPAHRHSQTVLESGHSPLQAQRPASPSQSNPIHVPEAQAAIPALQSEVLSEPVAAAPPATPRGEPEVFESAGEETLEISIGAIHLRVEAPGPQTVARPIAPPARAQQPTTPVSSTRSGLSRRALRRF